MNTTEQLERLVSLRDQGDLSEAEFEKAKAKLLSDEQVDTESVETDSGSANISKAIPGLWPAVGVFAGNFLFISIGKGDVARGFAVGAIAAVLTIVVFAVVRAVKRS